MKDLNDQKWTVENGTKGSGSFTDRDNKVIYMDPDLGNDTNSKVQVLAHEVGHAKYPLSVDNSSKPAYVNSLLADEGAATISNIKAQREILAAGGSDIGINGSAANQKKYNSIYDQLLKDGDAAKARNQIGSIFGATEHTSTTGQLYSDYYGDSYVPPKKP
jgi:type VI secretion system secreted protein VgrG